MFNVVDILRIPKTVPNTQLCLQFNKHIIRKYKLLNNNSTAM